MGRKRADLVLVERGLFESRAKARAAIEAGRVKAGGETVRRPSDLIETDGEIAAEPAFPWVGRAALKLVHALDLWPVAVAGRRVLDVGASTGGFTEVCLDRGAAHVVAVDVGRDAVVCDASFISLAKVLPRPLELARPGADLVALVKPQFEVGREGVAKGGVVKDAALRERALREVCAFLEGTGWNVRASAESPIAGGDGNLEYLVWATKKPPA